MKNKTRKLVLVAFLASMMVSATAAGGVIASQETIPTLAETTAQADEPSTNVAEVGNTSYATIDEAIAKWTNNTTLTLLADVTLSDVIKLSSTEYHILDLGTYTMTAASGKDAIQYVVNGRSSAGYALDIKADATNPGGITATGGSVVRHTKPLVSAPSKDRPITRFYGGVFNASYVVRQGGTFGAGYTGASAPYFQFYGGEYNGTIYTNRSQNQFYGGTFNGSMQMSVDSSAYTLVAGGTFKDLSNSMGSELNSDKFTIGSAKGVYDKEVYIDDNGNYVIAAAEPAEGIEAAVAKTPGTNDYLAYSKVATEGQLNYTDVKTAIEKNNSESAKITVYADEIDLGGITEFKGTLVVPEGQTLTIINAPENLKVEGVAQVGDAYYKDLHAAMTACKSGETVKLLADVDLAGTEWEPVSFKGAFDGQNHTIYNLTINKPGVSYAGFITSLNGEFKNVTFTNPTVTGGECTGVVAGRAGGSAALAENITVNGTIKVETTHSGYARAGVIVGGWAYGNYKNITVDGGDSDVSYIKHTGGGDGRYVAGIVGHADGVDSYENCTVKNITISGGWLCGGIAGPGPSNGLATGCTVENIKMNADYSGGMFGWYYGSGTIEDSTIKNVEFTDGSTKNGAIGGYSANEDATVSNVTIENVTNNGQPLLEHVASVNGTYYMSLAEAINAGGTITLLRDVTLTETLNIEAGKKITLDLNGKTIDFDSKVWVYGAENSGTALITVKFGGDLTIEDTSAEQTGTIDGYDNGAYNATGAYKVYGAVMMSVAGDEPANGTAKLTVNGGTLVGTFAAIGGNRLRDNTEIVINGGVIKCGVSENYSSVGIDHPQNGKLTINGGTIEGMDGISLRSGTLVIIGGTIKGTAPTTAFEEDGYWDNNFGTCTGHALQIVSRANSEATQETPSVTITGGTFISENTDAVGSYASNKGATPDPQIVEFISGGTFSSDVSAYCAEGYALTKNSDGTYGTVKTIISTLEELKAFRNSVNGGNNYAGVTVYLNADIDLNNEAWTPIGTADAKFEGIFDGQGNTISNLYVEGGVNQGFFGYATECTIKNIKLVNVTVIGTDCVGGIAGQAYSGSRIENCHVSGSIKIEGQTNVGGIVGKYYTRVVNCSVIGDGVATSYVKGVYTAANLEGDNVGGIMGHAGENNSHSGNTVKDITISGTRKVGGLIGTTNRSTDLSDCIVENVVIKTTATSEYASGNSATMTLGGLIGNYYSKTPAADSYGTVTNCTVKSVTFKGNGVATNIGPIVGGVRVAPTATECEGVTASGNQIYMSTITGSTNTYLMTAVAQIGETYYYAFAEAIAAAKDDETVTVIANISDAVTVNKAITLKGSEGVVFTGTIQVTADNVTLDSINLQYQGIRSEAAGTVYGNICIDSNNVTVKNSDFYAAYDENSTGIGNEFGMVRISNSNTGIVFDSCTFQTNTMAIFPAMATGEITNCTFKPLDDGDTRTSLSINGTVMTNISITGNIFNGMRILTNGTGVTIKNNQFLGFTSAPVYTGFISNSVVLDLSENYWGGQEPILDAAGKLTLTNYYTTVNDGTLGGLVSVVAQIGTHCYTTLADAIAAAQNGDTIKLLADAELAETTNIKKTITIDGNKHKITQTTDFAGNASNALLDISGGATVTFENLTFDAIKDVAIIRTVYSDVVMDNCVVQNCEHTVAQGLLRLIGNATITNTEFLNNDCTMVITFCYDDTKYTEKLTIDGCEFTGNTCNSTAVIYFANGVSATITDTSFINNTVTSTSNVATIYIGGAGNDYKVSGCTFKGNDVSTSTTWITKIASAIYCNGGTVNDNVFDSNTATRADTAISNVIYVTTSAYNKDGKTDLGKNYWGGNAPVPGVDYTIDSANSHTVTVANYYASYNEETGLTDLTGITYVAKVGNYSYTTLQAAVDAAQNGDTIKLLADIELDKTLFIEKSITLDGNGYKITQADTFTGVSALMLGTSGYKDAAIASHNVTLQNVVFDDWTTEHVVRVQGVEATIDGCTFMNSNQTAGLAALISTNYADVTIQNCIFKDNTCRSVIDVNSWADDSKSAVTVENCKFNNNTCSTTGLIVVITGSETTIENNEFVGNTAVANIIYAATDVTISGNYFKDNDLTAGTHNNDSIVVAGPWVDGSYYIAIIENAFFDDERAVYAENFTDSTFNLSGNYWNGGVPEYGSTGDPVVLLTNYYQSASYENGELILTDKANVTYVTQIGNTKYLSLADAIKAAQPGDTIKLLANVTVTEKFSLEGVNLDLNGKTLNLKTTGNYIVDTVTISNGTIDISGNEVDGNTFFTVGGQRAKAGSVLNLDNVNLVGNGYTTDWAVICVHNGTSLNMTNSIVDLKNDNGTNGGFIKDTSGVGNTAIVTIKDSTITLADVDRGFTGAKVILENVELTITGGEHGINGSELLIKDSTVSISNGSGRGITLNKFDAQIVNSTVTLTDMYEGGIRFKTANTLTVDGKSTLASTSAYADVAGATVNGYAVIGTEGYTSTVTVADGTTTVVNPYYAAQIGEAKYATLQAAIDAASAGATITLLADVTENVTIGKSITLDGANYKYTGTMTVSDNKNVTIKNVNFVKGCITEEKGSHGNLTIQNCTFDGVDKSIGYAITVRGGDKVVIENSTAKNYGYGMLYIPSSVATISVNEVTVSDCTAAFNISYSGNGTFENVTAVTNVTYGLHVQNYGARTFTLNNCNFTCDYPVFVQEKGTATVTFKFVGRYAFGTNFTGTQYAKFVLGDVATTLEACAGLNVISDVDNYGVDYVDGVYKLAIYVASVNDKSYTSLQAAIDAASAGATITLLDNITGTELVTVNKTVKLDLNGKNIENTATNWVLRVDDNSTMTLADSSVEKNGTIKGWKGINVAKGSKLIMEGGNIEVTGKTGAAVQVYGSEAVMNGGTITAEYGAILIYSNGDARGTFTMNGGEMTTKSVSIFANGSEEYDNVDVTITGGKITSTAAPAIYWPAAGKLTIKGGELTGLVAVYVKSGSLEITGGTLTGNGEQTDYSYVSSGFLITGDALVIENVGGTTGYEAVTSVSIIGGNFISENAAAVASYTAGKEGVNAVTGFISGGTFNTEIANGLLATGYKLVANSDGTYGVEVDPAYGKVAQIGDTYYATLADALKAITSGCTVEILSDVTITEAWDCRNNGAKITASNVTINGNGYTLKLTGEVKDNNWNTVFRFEADGAKVQNLTIDVSEATGVQRGISAKLGISVDECTFIGNGTTTKRAIIYGEGAGTAIGEVKVYISNSTFTNWSYGVSDNQNAQDAKVVKISGNVFTNANVLVSASEEVVFQENKMSNSYVNISSYSVPNELTASVKNNQFDGTATDDNKIVAKTITIEGDGNYLTPVAEVNGKLYITLQSAINAASAGDTIKLLADIELTAGVTVPAGKTITLDLNGKTVYMETEDDGAYCLILNEGNLTIADNSDGKNGKLSYKYTGKNNSDAYNTVETAPGSTLTVKGGTIENLSSNCLIAYAIDGLTNGNLGDVTVNIEGGVITSIKQSVRIFANSTTCTGTLNISGGTFSGRVIVQNSNTNANKAALSITGGTFNTNEYKNEVLYAGGSNGEYIAMAANVSGGTFNGAVISEMATGFITGGTFSENVSEFCAEGYICKYNGNETYGIQNVLFSGFNLTIGSDLTVNFYVTLTATEAANATMKFEFPDLENGFVTVKPQLYQEGTDKSVYVFRFEHVVPQQIGDTITATLSISGKEPVTMTYSVKDYCYGVLDSSTDKLGISETKFEALKTLIVNLLNYGAVLQEYRGYNKDTLVNADLEADQIAMAKEYEVAPKFGKVEGTSSPIKNVGYGLQISNAIKIRVAFTLYDPESINNIVVRSNGNTWTLNNGIEEGDGYYYVELSDIYATNFDVDYVFAFENTVTKEEVTVTYSVQAYVYAMQTNEKEGKLVKAMWNYGMAAEIYSLIQ